MTALGDDVAEEAPVKVKVEFPEYVQLSNRLKVLRQGEGKLTGMVSQFTPMIVKLELSNKKQDCENLQGSYEEMQEAVKDISRCLVKGEGFSRKTPGEEMKAYIDTVDKAIEQASNLVDACKDLLKQAKSCLQKAGEDWCSQALPRFEHNSNQFCKQNIITKQASKTATTLNT